MRYLKKIFLFVKNVFKSDYDNYVPYFWRKNSLLEILKLENIKFIRRLRIKYWHKKASNYPPFKPFFNEDDLRNAQQNNLLASEVRDIYKFGSAVIGSVLSKNDINLINKFANSLALKSDNNYVQVELPSSLSEVRNLILKKLQPIYEHFVSIHVHEKKFSSIYVGIRIDYSIDGIDSSPKTANWHVDRFLPTINAIYFPNGASWGQFEKDFGNPLITEKDIEYYVNDSKKNKKTPEEIRDKYYVQFNNRYKKKFTLKDNHMIVGTHHMQHRRSPIYSPGKRVAIFIDHYNFLTRGDLL